MSKKSTYNIKGEIAWSFAFINGRQGEVLFEKDKGIKSIFAHAYHTNKDKWSKKELQMIAKDTKKTDLLTEPKNIL